MFCSVFNIFYAGWQIKNWGPKVALVLQTAFPALRVGIQVVGVSVGTRNGNIIVQCSQLISLIGGMSGYLLVLNTIAGEITPPTRRTAMFGMLQGSVMLGTSIGYLLGGVVGDSWVLYDPLKLQPSYSHRQACTRPCLSHASTAEHLVLLVAHLPSDKGGADGLEF